MTRSATSVHFLKGFIRGLFIVGNFLLPIFLGAADQTEYTILAEDGAGLWGQPDGSGCGNDLVVAAFAASGIKVTLQTMPYVRAKTEVLQGRALACFGMARDPSLEGKIVFPSQALYVTRAVLFARARSPRLQGWNDIPRGSTVGVVRDYEYPIEVRSRINSGTLVPYPTNAEVTNLKMLQAGRLDYVICMVDDLKSPDFLVNAAQVSDSVEPVLATEPQSTTVGFAVGYPDSAKAITAFDRGMDLIKTNGVYASIVRRWSGRK